jgi:hypothetical protein
MLKCITWLQAVVEIITNETTKVLNISGLLIYLIICIYKTYIYIYLDNKPKYAMPSTKNHLALDYLLAS